MTLFETAEFLPAPERGDIAAVLARKADEDATAGGTFERTHDLDRLIEGVQGLGYPLGVHLECPYDFNGYAFEVFHTMLDVWSPG